MNDIIIDHIIILKQQLDCLMLCATRGQCSCPTVLQVRRVHVLLRTICAGTCDFQQCGILTSEGSDEPVQPHFKLRNLK